MQRCILLRALPVFAITALLTGHLRIAQAEEESVMRGILPNVMNQKSDEN